MSTTDVVVTGLGATTPLGGDVASTWDAMLAGRSGVKPLTPEWAEQLPVRIAAPLAVEPSDVIERVKLRRLDRSEAIALIAANQAWADAGLAGAGLDPERLAVSVGSGIGGAMTLLNQDDILEQSGPRRVSPYTVPMLMPNGPAAYVGLELGAKAGVHSMASACATGAEALSLGMDIIRAGRADVVIAGCTEAVIHPLPIAGFAAMRAMSTRNDEPEKASRPYDTGRDGFVLGEGAAVIVLESEEHAKARGAQIYAVLAGIGMSADAHHITAPEPNGAGASRAMKQAVESAGLSLGDISHINAHATSTPVGDVAEANAIVRAFGEELVEGIPVSGTKSMTGHLLGAAGALEALLTILAVRDRVAPATINLDDLDPAIPLDVVHGEHRKLPDGDVAAMDNSFGFGGHNVALVFTNA